MLNTEPQGSDAAGDDLTLTTPPDGAPTRRTRRRTTTAGFGGRGVHGCGVDGRPRR